MAAAERLVELGHGIDEASLMTLSRRVAADETPHEESAPDLHDYGRFMRPAGNGRRHDMTRPQIAYPDSRCYRASTGQLMGGIMGLTRSSR